ncbi:MAG: hypothetical protein QF828_06550 [Pseudomonadales bacterium]|jgi:hypothetical protein|nr:hypothetical protein [Pseudomonadales bacterium]MDP7358072.1 hypothetical protein [Pseudomonadales bacterium]HJN51218.1 hypothetical protein [Pseudomonadales bacterium]|tara:strand:+ start:1723 stop:2454 length:732 start_codon:yes stop_codon:yes gene_type:complete
MKTMLKIGVSVTLVLTLLGCQLTGGRLSEVDQIIDRYFEATGGRAANEAITSLKLKGGAYVATAGLDTDMMVYYKNGNYKRVIEIPGMFQVVMGVTDDIPWQLNPLEGDSILQGDQAVYQREDANINPLMDWRETYESAEITGEENGATVVVFTSRGGTIKTRHFDNASGLLIKEVQKDPTGGSSTVTSSDYKKVGDIMFSHKTVISSPAADIEVTITTVELNAQIDDSTFDLPSAIQSLLKD